MCGLSGTGPQSTDDLPRRSDIVVPVNVVIAPTTVLDRQGNYINGLTIDDFKLYDNDKPQRITADIGQEPLSLVVAVQATSMLNDVLPKIQHIGTMLDDLVVGQSRRGCGSWPSTTASKSSRISPAMPARSRWP